MKLKINSLSIGYGHQAVLSDINITAQSGDFIALIGKNGSGKSTFLKTMAGIIESIDGEIWIDKQDLLQLKPAERAKYVSVVLTDAILTPLKVKEFISLGRQNFTGIWNRLLPEDHRIMNQVIQELNLSRLLDKKITEISDGERQKVLISRALVQETPIVLLDEPTTHLDLENKAVLLKKLKKISQMQNKIIILSTHDINLILPQTNKVWFTNQSIEELEDNQKLKDLFDLNILRFDEGCQIFRLA